MENVLSAILQLFIFLISAVCVFFILKLLIPAVSLRINYSFDSALGRGIKKYKYPTGRAVVYEPHPSVRKYINRYVLFVNDGYKYLKCRLDKGVKNLKFEVIMFNNKNNAIDVLSVYASASDNSETREILLNSDTSYVILNVESANDLAVKRVKIGYYTLKQLGLYFGLVAFTVFIEMLIAAKTLGKFFDFIIDGKVSLSATGLYFMFSILFAVLAVVLVICLGSNKGIEVILNGKEQRNS